MQPAGLLQPLPVSSNKLKYCMLDFMTDLLEVNRFNALLVIMDKFGKLSRLVSYRAGEGKLIALKSATLFLNKWVHIFDVPCYVVHNRAVRFTEAFWKVLWLMFGMKSFFSSAYHP